MTEDEWKYAQGLSIDRLAIAIAMFHKLELDAVGDLEAANRWEMLQEILIGKREEAFREIRESLFLSDPEYVLAKARVTEWLKQRVMARRKLKAA